MKRPKSLKYVAAIAVLIAVAGGAAVYAQATGQDKRFTLKAPNGIAMSEFKGYDTWDVIGSSVTDDGGGCGSSPNPGCIKSIVGNAVMIGAYKAGIPANGKPVPNGAMMAKIEWFKARDPALAYGAIVPGTFMEVAFMIKDAKRFPETNGWGYATLKYDAKSDTFRAFAGEAPEFHKTACHGCHTLVKERDFVFTKYQKR